MEQSINRLTIRQLRLVCTVGEEGSLIAAADRLFLTQPAVTKALKEAEAMLGVRLFDRTNRGMVPTPYGNALISHARLIDSQLKQAAAEIEDIRDGTGGRISVGAMPSATAELLPHAISRLREGRPNLIVSIVEGTTDLMLPALRSSTLDFIVGRLPEYESNRDVNQETLFLDAVCIVARPGHPLAGRKSLNLADLAQCEWILPPAATTLRGEVERDFRALGAPLPRVVVESNSLLCNRYLLLKSDYLTVWPWQVAKRTWDLGNIAILPVTLRRTYGAVGITTRARGRLSPAASHLIQVMRDVAAEMDIAQPDR